jgi:hypothetical protein
MSRNGRWTLPVQTVARALLAAAFAVLIATMAFFLLSCGSDETQEPPQQQVSQEENAQELGRIMGYRNQIEGELNEPVEALIAGDVTAVADAGEETWLLVKVADFRCTSVPQDTLQATPGSELSVRLRETEELGPLSAGDSVEINAIVSKSMEGPVIIGRAYIVVD